MNYFPTILSQNDPIDLLSNVDVFSLIKAMKFSWWPSPSWKQIPGLLITSQIHVDVKILFMIIFYICFWDIIPHFLAINIKEVGWDGKPILKCVCKTVQSFNSEQCKGGFGTSNFSHFLSIEVAILI